MVTPPSIISDDRGRTIVVKAGRGQLGDRRRHEAEVLERGRHPGVVELLAVADDGHHVELRLEHIPAPPIADHPPLAAADLARIGAAVGETLADLHHGGIAHGHVAADHVLVADDRVVLCGLADATDADDGTAPADVVALCKLLRRQLDRSVEADVIESRDPIADRLRTLLDEVVAEAELARDGGRAPTARAVAGRLAEMADGARPGTPTGRFAARWRLDARTVVVAAAVVALTGVAVVIAIRTLAPGGTDDAPTPSPSMAPEVAAPTTAAAPSPAATSDPTSEPAAPTTTAAPPPAATSDPASPARGGPESASTGASSTSTSTGSGGGDDDPSLVLAAPTSCRPVADGWSATDIDGDGCPDGWRADEGVLEVGELRYSLGGADDLVVVGDWDCDDTATPALVTVDSGGVFLFPRWASDSEEVTVEAVGVVPDPVATEVTSVDGCDVLTVLDDDGEHRFGGRS